MLQNICISVRSSFVGVPCCFESVLMVLVGSRCFRYARKLEFNGRPPEEMPEGHFKKPAPPKKLSRSEELEKLFDDVTAEIEERHQVLAV